MDAAAALHHETRNATFSQVIKQRAKVHRWTKRDNVSQSGKLAAKPVKTSVGRIGYLLIAVMPKLLLWRLALGGQLGGNCCATPTEANARSAVAIVVNETCACRPLFSVKSDRVASWPKSDANVKHLRLAKTRLDGSAAVKNAVGNNWVRPTVPDMWLCTSAENDVIFMRVDPDQVERITRVDLQKIGQAGIVDHNVLSANRIKVLVSNETPSTQASAVNDMWREIGDRIKRAHRADLDSSAGRMKSVSEIAQMARHINQRCRVALPVAIATW